MGTIYTMNPRKELNLSKLVLKLWNLIKMQGNKLRKWDFSLRSTLTFKLFRKGSLSISEVIMAGHLAILLMIFF